jgi:hypothetical protein
MTIFHLNPLNERLGICHGSTRSCPLSRDNHFTSLEAATQALEHNDFSKALDEAANEALIALDRNLGSQLVDYELAKRINEHKEFGERETKLLILLGKALSLDSSTEDKALVKDEKAKLLAQISDIHFIKNKLSSKEKQLLDNLISMKKRWLKNWN